MSSLTITLDDALLEEVRRRAQERGTAAEQVAAEAVREKYGHGGCADDGADDPDDGLTRGQRMARQLVGTATEDITYEQIAEYTRSDV